MTSCVAVALLALMGCGGAPVRVDIRNYADTSRGKVIVLPMLVWDGQRLRPGSAGYSNPAADERLAKEWSVDVGAANTVFMSNAVLDGLPGGYAAVDAVLARRETTSVTGPDSGLADFMHLLASRFSDGALAVALVSADEHAYLASGRLRVTLGLFDPGKQVWKWLTEITYARGICSLSRVRAPYQETVAALVGDSFAALKKKSGGAVR